ncbi:MAG: glycosyltransferase family 2 protein [Moorea sp. SIOASIH]|uniref:glycosyltransferase family 2 protein n=1 Tax=Moorena sp. SIOASIH TaxID=2607817 RepID=UPI0013BA0391|nr:glycosyltransferase family 2 protein [Moorena sp. SIOASIH]NEO38822.1 glycosyltransferase family 2 protein [Moorena sp. SIOASIH]
MKPLVSVVIPTYRRPKLVKRAVQSALAQTLSQIEVIVVIDGPHEATCASLTEVDDSRLRVIELPTNQGCTAARRAGVAAAQAPWIAHLDDDDEWMPQKLELQLEAANRSQYKYPIVSCYLIARTPQNDSIWPRRIPSKSEPLSEYLFVRNTFFQGEAVIQGSTILTSKELLQKIPFRSSADDHDDWDWLLRATTLEEVGIEFVTEPLSVWYLGENRPSISSTTKWRNSLNWIQKVQDLVTPRAYASFILTEVSSRAAKACEWKAFFPLLWEAIRHGKPLPMDIGLYFGMWLLSPKTRGWLRNLLTKNPQPLTT